MGYISEINSIQIQFNSIQYRFHVNVVLSRPSWISWPEKTKKTKQKQKTAHPFIGIEYTGCPRILRHLTSGSHLRYLYFYDFILIYKYCKSNNTWSDIQNSAWLLKKCDVWSHFPNRHHNFTGTDFLSL